MKSGKIAIKLATDPANSTLLDIAENPASLQISEEILTMTEIPQTFITGAKTSDCIPDISSRYLRSENNSPNATRDTVRINTPAIIVMQIEKYGVFSLTNSAKIDEIIAKTDILIISSIPKTQMQLLCNQIIY